MVFFEDVVPERLSMLLSPKYIQATISVLYEFCFLAFCFVLFCLKSTGNWEEKVVLG